MYAGRIVEEGTLDEIFYDPQHPYTWGLLGSITRVDRPRPSAGDSRAPPSLADRPGAATSAALPARVRECSEVPPLEAHPGNPERPAAAGCPASRKRDMPRVLPGEIGLGAKAKAQAGVSA